MILAKKRFEILKRDGFKCQYCGKNGKDVTLEVDHIIPISKGGDDNINNLCCSCRECNMGKGSNTLDSEELYKIKIKDNINKSIKYFYDTWNENNMGNITKNTYILLSKFIIFFSEKDNFKLRLGPKNYKEFIKGGIFCDRILLAEYDFLRTMKIQPLIKRCLNDDERIGKHSFNIKLNYLLTYYLRNIEKTYFLKKYTLFPNLIINNE